MTAIRKEMEDKYYGRFIKITYMADEPRYEGKTGKVDYVDDMGQLHGSWGGLAVIPGEDEFEVVG